MVIQEANRYGTNPRLEADFVRLRSGVTELQSQLATFETKASFGGSPLSRALASNSLEALLTRDIASILDQISRAQSAAVGSE